MKLSNGPLLVQSHSQSNNYTIEQPHFQSNIWYIARIFQICLVPVGYEDLTGGLEPIRNGKIF